METTENTKKIGQREFVGIVTSDKMNKTIVVEVRTKKLHKLYKKYVSSSKKYKAHDEENTAHIGDTVRIVEHKPISKDKAWMLTEVIERAK